MLQKEGNSPLEKILKKLKAKDYRLTTNRKEHKMNQNRQSNRPRKRLSQKQLTFLRDVFEANGHVTDALRNLNIRPDTLERWLTRPPFIKRLRVYLNHYAVQARMEIARTLPAAISGLSKLTENALRYEEVRRACTDLLNFYTRFARIAPPSKQLKNGVVLDNFSALLEQIGIIVDKNGNVLDKKGNVLDYNGSADSRQNRLLDTKNEENNKNPHLITSSTPNPPAECMNNIDD
jgi:hypothetical protein